jgi:hypothetical protein
MLAFTIFWEAKCEMNQRECFRNIILLENIGNCITANGYGTNGYQIEFSRDLASSCTVAPSQTLPVRIFTNFSRHRMMMSHDCNRSRLVQQEVENTFSVNGFSMF